MAYRFFTLLFLSLLFAACSPNETVSLDWKIEEGEILAYRTSINAIDRADSQFNFDAGETSSDVSDFVNMFQSAIEATAPEASSLISLLELNDQGNIDIRVIVHEMSFAEDTQDGPLTDYMRNMQGTVQLRGAVQPDGAIASFYLEQQQRNLIAFFFELPTQPVSVGDSWQIDVHCVSMGAVFIAEKANRENHIELSEITQTEDGKRVAIVDYVIVESVEGIFESTFSDDVIPSSATCSFLGRGQFLIDEGRWQQLVGEFSVSITGYMMSDTTQQLALTILDEVPEAYRE